MGRNRENVGQTKYGITAMWGSLCSLVVGTVMYLAATFWIKCPPVYGDTSSCRKVEGAMLASVLAVYAAMAPCSACAVVGIVAMIKREPRWPAVVAIGMGVVLVFVNWAFSNPTE